MNQFDNDGDEPTSSSNVDRSGRVINQRSESPLFDKTNKEKYNDRVKQQSEDAMKRGGRFIPDPFDSGKNY